MNMTNKKIRKAIYRLKVDGKTPKEVIDFIGEKLLTKKQEVVSKNNNTIKNNNVVTMPTTSYTGMTDICILRNVSLNTGNGLVSKSGYKTLCDNYKKSTGISYPLDLKQTNEVIQHIKVGCKLEAVKTVKSFSNFGLKECKDIVDSFCRKTL